MIEFENTLINIEYREIYNTLAASLAAEDIEIVKINWSQNSKFKILQILVEASDGKPLDIARCSEISRTISALLDVEDNIAGRYNLEVSTAGIDKPLTRLKDFVAATGKLIKLELRYEQDGIKRIKGIVSVDGDKITIEGGNNIITVDFTQIAKAKLVLTDELLGLGKGKKK